MSFLHCVVLLSALAPDAAARETIEFTEDPLNAVAKNIAGKKAVLVDVRSVEEWNKGHVDGAIFVPVTSLRKHSLDPKKLAKTLPKNKKTILYTHCVVGMRAKAAGIILKKQGFTVRVLKPGYEELIKAGFKKSTKKYDEKATADDEDSRQRNAG
jgi:phage shock protein E